MAIQHIAFIMDGNGRWAKEKGLSRSEGHKAGAKAVRKIITRAREVNLPYLTLYALSRENLERPLEEVRQLFSLLVQFVTQEVPNLIEKGIALHCIGDIESLPFASQKALKYAIEKTQKGTQMQLCLALAYSAKEEIARACLRLNEKEKLEEYTPLTLAQKISESLDAPSFPDPDLIIRTGGDRRLSNFLLFQAAYSELYFTSLYFPDFDGAELDKAIDDFYTRKRRFGKTDEQVDEKSKIELTKK